MTLDDLLTPALVLDEGRMTRNIERMRGRLARARRRASGRT